MNNEDQNQSQYRQPGPQKQGDENKAESKKSPWANKASPWLQPGAQNNAAQPPAVQNQSPAPIQHENANPPVPEPRVPTKALDFGSEIRKMISTAGTLDLTPDQHRILFEPVKDYHIKMKEDGSMYLPWTWYHDRLTRAFGNLKWAMVPEGLPKLVPNNLIMWGFHLVAHGVYMGFALGEMTFIPKNARMTYGEACEGAKSNALMRLCKSMGISLELWDKDFAQRWEHAYATYYEDASTGKTKWKLKDGVYKMFQDEIRRDKEAAMAPIQQAVVVETTAAKATSSEPIENVTKRPLPQKPKKKSSAAVNKPLQNELPLETEKSPGNTKSQPAKISVDPKLQPYVDKIAACTSTGQVKKIMDTVKADLSMNLICEEDKEALRIISNKHCVTLSKSK